MKNFRRALLLAAALFVGGQAMAAEEIVIVVNSENPTAIDLTLVRNLYWGRKRFWPRTGFAVELSMRSPQAPVTMLFLTDYLDTKASRFDRYWKGRMLSGQGSDPVVIRELDALIDFCVQQPGAIGFVSLREADRVVNPRIRKIRLHN